MAADTPPRTAKAKLREVRATLIMDAAEEVFVEKGYHDASMDEIAARAGVAKGTLYQHFPGKEDLVFALFERSLALFEQAVEQAAAVADLTARARLERILHYVYVDLSGVHALLQLHSQNVDLRTSLRGKKAQLQDRLEKCKEQLRKIIEDGKAEGIFDPTLSTGLMLGAFLNALMLNRQERLTAGEQLSAEELVNQIGRILFEGFSPHS
jgi:AcrR family transcriptional regulator